MDTNDRTYTMVLTGTLPEGWTAEDLREDVVGLLAGFRREAQKPGPANQPTPLSFDVQVTDSPALRAMVRMVQK